MLGVFSEFETNLRQADGSICAGQGERGLCRQWAPASIDLAQVRQVKAQGLGATAIAKTLGITFIGNVNRPGGA